MKIKNFKASIKFIYILCAGSVLYIPLKAEFFNDHNEKIIVVEKYKTKDNKYIIKGIDKSLKEKEFENTNSLIRWKFNSQKIQDEIEIGEEYDVTLIGHHNDYFSKENIIKVLKKH